MEIIYREDKQFTAAQLQQLFTSVGWLSANYPDRLEKAINGSDTVISAWEGEQLVGLVNALDDGALTAYAHYLLVDPRYQGRGVGREMVTRLKKKYEGYLYLLLLAEEKELIPFYQQLGFSVKETSIPLGITTP